MDIKAVYEVLYRNVIEEHSQVFEAQNLEDIEKLMTAIMNAKRVFIVGAGREGIAARSFAMRVMHLGKETHWLWDDTAPGMRAGDLFIAVNGSGKIGHIDYLLDRAHLTGTEIAVVTGAPSERTPSMADITVFVPACVYKGTDKRVVNSTQPMGNLFEQHLFLLFDIIVMMLEKEMNLSHDQMEARHRNIE
ncbi:MAG: sugar isomerase [Clostridia bacterium]|jgi:6-phospho-3-hexuloisomerase|nr:sugar isomerase [Clostridia bacterium]